MNQILETVGRILQAFAALLLILSASSLTLMISKIVPPTDPEGLGLLLGGLAGSFCGAILVAGLPYYLGRAFIKTAQHRRRSSQNNQAS